LLQLVKQAIVLCGDRLKLSDRQKLDLGVILQLVDIKMNPFALLSPASNPKAVALVSQ
jgi:hypothetical protein